jgi:hypothetical protein
MHFVARALLGNRSVYTMWRDRQKAYKRLCQYIHEEAALDYVADRNNCQDFVEGAMRGEWRGR